MRTRMVLVLTAGGAEFETAIGEERTLWGADSEKGPDQQ
jgi:hypothetical protein